MLFWIGFWLPSHVQIFLTYPPSNVTYAATNRTSSLYLSVQTVPTLLNGVTTATSIVAGFTGTIIGVVYRKLSKETRKDRVFRGFIITVIPILFALVLIFDFFGYIYLLQGGVWFLTAIDLILSAFILALLIFVSFFILIGVRLNEQDERQPCDRTNQQPPATTNPQPQTQTRTEWKITIRNGDKMLEATGMDTVSVDTILKSWNTNINPANPEEKETSDAKT